MKKTVRLLSLLLAFVLCMTGNALAAGKKETATPVPPPVDITTDVIEEVPEQIQQMLDIAHAEWEELQGKKQKKSNKYTKWWNNYDWEWCAGFVTWCMLEAGIPTELEPDILAEPEGSREGVFCVRGSSPAKYSHAFLHMHRVTMVPQKGFVLLYGKKGKNGTWHVGIVYDVQSLGDGKYRITTLEGNVKNSVWMFVHDYDMNADKKAGNISLVPKDEQTETDQKAFSYKYTYDDKDMYVNYFLMTWIPGETDNP